MGDKNLFTEIYKLNTKKKNNRILAEHVNLSYIVPNSVYVLYDRYPPMGKKKLIEKRKW